MLYKSSSSSECTDPPLPQSHWLPKSTYRLKSISSKYQFVFTDDTVPLNSAGNLLQHFQPERRNKIKYSFPFEVAEFTVTEKGKHPPEVKHSLTPTTQYLCPSKDSLPKLMQELTSVGPQCTERKFSFESRLVRVLVVLLNTESLLR